MGTELEIFNYNSTEIRTIVKDGEPWWVAADVANVLGYVDVNQAVRKNVDEEDKMLMNTPSAGRGNPNKVIINESGLYALIFGSKLPTAKQFKRWVTTEVLPALRKTGSYSVAPALPQSFAEALQLAADQAKALEEKEAQLAIAVPIVEKYEELTDPHATCLLRDAVKELNSHPSIRVREGELRESLVSKRVLLYSEVMGKSQYKPSAAYTDRFSLAPGAVLQDMWFNKEKLYTLRVRPSGVEWLRKKILEGRLPGLLAN